jgi:hypothetical protein
MMLVRARVVPWSSLRRRIAMFAAAAMATLAVAPSALAVAPPNDDFANAEAIGSLPFSVSADVGEATSEPGEPAGCTSSSQSVWYSYTPARDGVLRARITQGDTPNWKLNAWLDTSAGIEGLGFAGCSQYGGDPIAFDVQAGATYYLQLGAAFDGSVRTLDLMLEEIPSPPNDDFANATEIGALPFTATVDTSGATIEPGEPRDCNGAVRTAWYRITPATDGVIKASASFTAPSGQDGAISMYRSDGAGFGGLSLLDCAYAGAVVVNVEAGVTYYIQAGGSSFGPGELRIDVEPTERPANDSFASASPIESIPFDVTTDGTVMTLDAGEPPTCGYQPSGSVWYAFTPAEETSVFGLVLAAGFGSAVLGVYTGDTLDALSSVSCAFAGQPVTFRARAGVTYYLQVSALDNPALIRLKLDPPPPPQASFVIFPVDLSRPDRHLQFFDTSHDPGGAGIESQEWDFGDGATASGCCPTHLFTEDGDYVVRLEVTTRDGRTATAEQTVSVRTHDISIQRFVTPKQVQIGHTRPIRVEVANRHYPETVHVQLLRNLGNGFEPVGALTQDVAVRSRGRTTSFDFEYTFTSADRGGVTFKAVATLLTARDAEPADNEVTSSVAAAPASAAVTSSAGDPWTDSLGGSGNTALTFGHIGCWDVDAGGFCSSGVWSRVPGARWIWKTQLVSPDEAVNGTSVVTFRKQFKWKEPAGTGASLAISADDHYRVFLNGALVAEGTLRHFSHDTHALTPRVGVNLLEIEVQSSPGPSDPLFSPAGLAYAITPTGP